MTEPAGVGAAVENARRKSAEKTLPLDRDRVADWSDDALNEYLSRVFSSTAFAVDDDRRCVRLMGQDRRHHQIDRGLLQGLRPFGINALDQVGAARWQDGPLFLTLEDSWSGWLLAALLSNVNDARPLVILHLDDHQDMMPSLLSQDDTGQIWDPVAHAPFDVTAQRDWERAIASGVVNIGTWLTALILGLSVGPTQRQVHIRHLHPRPGSTEKARRQFIAPRFKPNPELQQLSLGEFAFSDDPDAQSRGSYQASDDVADLTTDLPNGLCVLHIDLDYFVNDFNGNACSEMGHAPVGLPPSAKDGLARLDEMLTLCPPPIAQTIIATSPGFCAAQHWPALLERIKALLLKHGSG